MQTYDPQHESDYSPAQQIAIILAIVLVLLLAAFLYQFFETYKTELNQAVFFGFSFMGILILITACFSAFYIAAMLILSYQSKRQAMRTIAVNNELFAATAHQIKSGHVYLSEQKTELGIISHNALGKWSDNYEIVGHGRDYKAIENELNCLIETMDSRYKELAKGIVKEREHELITVICDEWTTVSKNIENLNEYLLPLLTESRKVGIDFILATHSQTAESLGLKGKADLKTAFDYTLFLKNVDGERLVDLNNGETVTTYYHSGEYNYCDNVTVEKEAVTVVKKDTDSLIVEKYLELKKNNQFSWNKLSKAIYGNANGQKVAHLKAVLVSHDIVMS